jgi:Recombination endonuclease VII
LYGITLEQWDAQMAAQGGRCAICRREDWGGRHGAPTADHDHADGRFRGILCDWCNRGLGQFSDNPVLLRAAADYLEGTRSMNTDLVTA